jgi:hypothetical protein
MKKFKALIVLLVFCNRLAFGQSDTEMFMDFAQKEPKLKTSHWIFYLHVDAIQLRPLTQYQMVHKQINSRKELYIGGGPGIARRFVIAFPLSTVTEVNTILWTKNDVEAQKPNKQDINTYEVMRSESSDQFYGIQISQSLNFAIETKYMLIEPFVQFGVGVARLQNKLSYKWDTNITSEYESYNSEVNENLVTQSLAGGIQFIAMNGFITYFKFQKNIFTIGTRETKTTKVDVGTSEVRTSSKVAVNQNQDEYSYGLGFGYVF